MTVCRFCKSEIAPEATRCPYCTSFVGDDQKPVIPGKVVYVLDTGLVTFLKYAGSTLAIFLTVALSFFSLDLKKLAESVSGTHAESQKLDINIKQAQFDLEKQKADLEKQKNSVVESVSAAQLSAKQASESAAGAFSSSKEAAAILDQMSNIRQAAEQSGRQIEEYRIRVLVPLQDRPPSPKTESNPIQLEKVVETKVLQTLKMTLSAQQYAAIELKLKATAATGLRRRIFDAQNKQDIPGTLVRSEGDAPAADQLVNQIYDHLGTVHTFFKEIFGRDLSEDANGGLVATIHYGRLYNNGFWNGNQLTLGDGDGKTFKKGAFTNLQVVATELCHAVIEKTSGLAYEGQSGALNSSFGDVCAVLLEQWTKKQSAEEASWLLLPDMLVGARALRSLKEPGTAYPKTILGGDIQVATMLKFSDEADVHVNSGIANKAFYELAMRLKGYAWEKPGKIWYEAYLTLMSASKFQDLADAMVKVATRLYGARSPERDAVVQSWAAVGITTGT
jgi:Zn-dependent metalloprotease